VTFLSFKQCHDTIQLDQEHPQPVGIRIPAGQIRYAAGIGVYETSGEFVSFDMTHYIKREVVDGLFNADIGERDRLLVATMQRFWLEFWPKAGFFY